jgi:hypothetical protein
MLSVEMVNHEWASVFCGKELAGWWDLDSGDKHRWASIVQVERKKCQAHSIAGSATIEEGFTRHATERFRAALYKKRPHTGTAAAHLLWRRVENLRSASPAWCWCRLHIFLSFKCLKNGLSVSLKRIGIRSFSDKFGEVIRRFLIFGFVIIDSAYVEERLPRSK